VMLLTVFFILSHCLSMSHTVFFTSLSIALSFSLSPCHYLHVPHCLTVCDDELILFLFS
jgi:hypothetical protein